MPLQHSSKQANQRGRIDSIGFWHVRNKLMLHPIIVVDLVNGDVVWKWLTFEVADVLHKTMLGKATPSAVDEQLRQLLSRDLGRIGSS